MQDALNPDEPNPSSQLLPRTNRENEHSSSSAAESHHPTHRRSSPSTVSRISLSSSRRSRYRAISDNTDSISPFDAIVEPEWGNHDAHAIVSGGASSHVNQEAGAPQDRQERSSRESQKTETVSDHQKLLKRHTLALWLVSMFALVTIFAWTITCVLCFKPIQPGTYYDRFGKYTREQYSNNDRWRRLSRVLISLLTNVSIPVTSAICARAVAVYCQRSSKLRSPNLTMRQTLALADKGWTDTTTLTNLLNPNASRKTGSPLLLLSALLCGLCKNEVNPVFTPHTDILFSSPYIYITGGLDRHPPNKSHD